MVKIMPVYEQMFSIEHITVVLYMPNSENMSDS